MKHPEASLEELMQFIKGPDFPTGGILQGLDGIKKAYETGREENEPVKQLVHIPYHRSLGPCQLSFYRYLWKIFARSH